MSDAILNATQTARDTFFTTHAEILADLVKNGQKPKALFIGCSDSRVTPEKLLGLAPGDMFMLRNIANIVPPFAQADSGIVSVLEYAIVALNVPHIIVCGHTECGGIRGLDNPIDSKQTPALAQWLTFARPAQTTIDASQPQLTDAARHIAIVERNVANQLQNIESYPFVQQALAANKLTLHGWVYYLAQQKIGYHNKESGQFHK